jgi:hypothetical protein
MQITLQVEDSFVPNLLDYLKQFKEQVVVEKDFNLEYDSYFYERQKRLQKIRSDIKSANKKLISFEELESKYAN